MARKIRLRFSDGKVREVPFVDLMKPKPTEGIPEDGWIAEEKKDGSLTLRYVVDGAVAYANRRGKDKTAIYPELTGNVGVKSKGLTITQGETYALEGGTDSFEGFLRRDLVQSEEEAEKRKKTWPLRYEAFDILMKDGKWVTELPLEERKKLLGEVVKRKDGVRVAKYGTDPSRFTKEKKRDSTVEGVVFKRLGSTYQSGRQGDWRKLKFVKQADVVIMGYAPGHGRREDIGSLQVGVWDRGWGKVREVAMVGTGFTDQELGDIKRRLDKKERLYAKVAYLKVGSRGGLRAPSFKGLRTDIGSVRETHV
jgi:ATP-dependent DNA ligase